MGFAWLLMCFRDQISNIFSILLANVLLFLGIAVEVYSIFSYSQKNIKFNKQVFFILALASSIFFVVLANTSDQIKIAISSFLNGVIFLTGFIFLLKYRNKSKLHIISTILFFYLSSILFTRGLAAIFFVKDITLTSQGVIQNLAFSSFLLVTFLSTILFLLLLKEKNDLVLKEKNIEIQKANELLALSNKAKDRLFSIISHDLRGSVGSITNLCELLVNKDIGLTVDDYKKFIPEIYKASSAANELLNNLLNWARSQLNEIVVNPTSFKLSKLITDAVAQLESRIVQKQITVLNNVDNKIDVFTDYEMIQVVTRNLLSNAIKFSENSGKIVIDANENSDQVKITIKDDGTGITPDIIEKLFNPDIHYTTPGTENEKGTGIGLKLSKNFIERNQGTLTINSEPNKGSAFSFTVLSNHTNQ